MRVFLIPMLATILATGAVSLWAADEEVARPASSPVSAEDVRQARLALRTMAQNFKAVTSGVCRIECAYKHQLMPDTVVPIGVDVPEQELLGEHILVAFDNSLDLYRYDSLETGHTGRPRQLILTQHQSLIAPADWMVNGDRIPDASRVITRQSRSDVVSPYDRCRDPFATVFGGASRNDMGQTQMGMDDNFLDERLQKAELVGYQADESGLIEIRLRESVTKLPGRYAEFTFKLDASRNYIPLYYTSRHNVTRGSQWSVPEVTEVDWQYTNHVYVPVLVKAQGTDWRKSELEFKMSWENVNEPVPESYFSEEALTLVNGDHLMAKKADITVIERVVGAKTFADLPVKETPDMRRRWAWIFGTHIPLGIALWWWTRRRKRRVDSATM